VLEPLGTLSFSGDLVHPLDISGVAIAGDYLLLGSDEGQRLQVLERETADRYRVTDRVVALAPVGKEVDIEAVSFADGFAYAVGSHALRRRALDPEHASVAQNRRRLLKVDRQKSRNRLVRFAFDPSTGETGPVERVGLGKWLRKHPLLGRFTRLPSKENGVDIEGLACRAGELFLGFRAPVLRHNLVPVAVLDFARPRAAELRLLQLDGTGIRDLAAVDGGFLVLSGPVNDAAAPHALWFWDGRDQLPGSDRRVAPARRLGEVPVRPGHKAEGLALVREDQSAWEVLVAFDAALAGQPSRFRVPKPPGSGPPA
jgi:hypothetical protein